MPERGGAKNKALNHHKVSLYSPFTIAYSQLTSHVSRLTSDESFTIHYCLFTFFHFTFYIPLSRLTILSLFTTVGPSYIVIFHFQIFKSSNLQIITIPLSAERKNKPRSSERGYIYSQFTIAYSLFTAFYCL